VEDTSGVEGPISGQGVEVGSSTEVRKVETTRPTSVVIAVIPTEPTSLQGGHL